MLSKFEKHYGQLAIEEPDDSISQDYYWIARRSKELRRKNGGLMSLHDRISELPDTEDTSNLIPIGEWPVLWQPGFENGEIQYLKRVTELVDNRKLKGRFMQAVEEIKRLSAINYAIRDSLNRYRDVNRGAVEWRQWIADYERAVEQQAECWC